MATPREDTIAANWRVFVACGIIVLSPFQYGVDFGLIGGLQAMVGFLKIYGNPVPVTVVKSGWNISPTRQQLISSLMTLGAFVSSATAGFAAIKLGRKMCLWIAAVACCIANIIMMTTESIEALYFGRLLIGLANGYFMTFSQLYIQESSPAKYRGLFLTMFTFCTSFGTLIGTIVDWATAGRPDKSSYLIPLGVIYIVPVIMSIGMVFIPESPRWLMLQNRSEEARHSLEWLRPAGCSVEAELAEIRAAIDHEKELGSSVGLWDMFRNPIDRRRTILSICAVTLQAGSGSMYLIAYKAYYLIMAGVQDAFAMSCVLSTTGLLAIIINSLIVVRWGFRRNLLMAGFIVCGILQLICAVVYDKGTDQIVTGKVIVALSCLYMMSYNAMIGPYAWLAGGEIPSQRLRSYTFGMAAAVGFFGAWLTTFTAPYFINPQALNWGPKYGYIWFPSCIICLLWVFFFLPETKGRTLEEIDEMFDAKLAARKFRGYKCIGMVQIDHMHRKSSEGERWDNEKGIIETEQREMSK